MSAEAELIVVYKGKDSGLKSTTNEAGSSIDRLKSAAKTAGVAIAAGIAVGTAALTAAGVKMISLASDAAEMQGKFDVVFANVGGKVARELDAFADAVGRSQFELRGMASDLGDVLKPLGFTEAEAGDLSVQLVQLATDLSSFNNIPMDEALARLRGTLVGAHENALAFGVVINENTIKAELLKNGWSDLEGEALELAKVQARINLLMAGTADAQGDAERTAGSFANVMRGLKADITDAATALGLSLLPAVTSFLDLFISPVIDGVKDFFQRLADAKLGESVASFLEKIASGDLVGGFDDLVVAAGNLLSVFGVDPEKITTFLERLINIRDTGIWLKRFFEDINAGNYEQAFGDLTLAAQELALALGLDGLAGALELSWENAGKFADLVNTLRDGTKELLVNYEDMTIALSGLTLSGKDMNAAFNITGTILDFLNEKAQGFFNKVNDVMEVVTFLAELLQGDFTAAGQTAIEIYNSLGGTIGYVRDMMRFLRNDPSLTDLQEWWKSLFPEWLIPGSPTPFEMGLRGIAGALDDMNRAMIPAFSGGGASTVNNTSTRNNSVNLNIYTQRTDPITEGRAALAWVGGV